MNNTLNFPTISGLQELNLDSLTTTNLDANNIDANNIDGEYFSIDTIEANNVLIDNELFLTNSGYIIIGKATPLEIIITDVEVSYLDGLTGNIQNQINNFDIDISDLEDNVADNSSNIAINLGYITSNAANIVANSGNITTNSTNITTNSSNIAINLGYITSNTTNITTNTTNITTNTGNILTLQNKTQYLDLQLIDGRYYLYSPYIDFVIQTFNAIIFLRGSRVELGSDSNSRTQIYGGLELNGGLQISAFTETIKNQITNNQTFMYDEFYDVNVKVNNLIDRTQNITATNSITNIETELFCVDDLQLNNGQTRFTYAGGQSYFQSADWVRFSQLYNATTNDFFVSTTNGNVYVNGVLYINYIQSFPYSSTEKAQVAQNTADIVVLKYLKTFETKFYFDARILGINASYTIPAGTYNLSDYDYKIGYNDFPGLFHPTTNLWTGGSKRIKVTYSMSQNLLTNTDLTVWKSQVYKKNISTGARNPRSLYIGPHYAVSNRLNRYIQNECSVVMHIVNGEQIFISTTFQAIVNSTLSVEIENKIEIVEL